MAKQKDIFKTLKNYSRGFHDNNSAESNMIYDAKVAVLNRVFYLQEEQL